MGITISIPDRTHEEFGHSLNKLFRTLSELHNSSDSRVTLDFSNARMLNPFFLGGLACAIRYYEQKGRKFELNHQNNYNINTYLQAIYFPGCYTPENGAERAFMERLEQYKNKTYIPIIAFPTGIDSTVAKVRENVLGAVSGILKRQLNFAEKNLTPISYLIDEMTHNIIDHSQAEQGFIFAQYYPASN